MSFMLNVASPRVDRPNVVKPSVVYVGRRVARPTIFRFRRLFFTSFKKSGNQISCSIFVPGMEL
jgi:hypothetical protein